MMIMMMIMMMMVMMMMMCLQTVCHRLGIDTGDRLQKNTTKRKFLITALPNDEEVTVSIQCLM